ncbi:MAG: DUF542 domain-containing protein [Gemmatimonadaceae bacterium]|nr:DUF542 domain-containing protein [Gemmatimonadaceae bacterium]
MTTTRHAPLPTAQDSTPCACSSSSAVAPPATGDATAISETMSVRTITQLLPASMPVLTRMGIDTCCGAGASLRDAATTAGLPLDQVLAALTALTHGPA